MSRLKIGLQLYSVCDALKKDFEGTLKQISGMGYEYVEFAGFYGKTAKEMKALLDRFGLKAISVHQGYDMFLPEAKENIEYLKTIGVKYAAIPGIRHDCLKGGKNYEDAVKDITIASDNLMYNGIKLLYHNHDYEFKKYEGKVLNDWLIGDLGDKVDPEIDVCWVYYAGYDPCEYMKKYKSRIPVLHIKDFVCLNLPNGPIKDRKDDDGLSLEDTGFRFRPIGQGIQDIPKIIKTAEECGTEYLIVEDEQDAYTEISSLDSVKQSIDYLRSIGL